jgi:Glycosyltransferase family 87
MTHVESEETDAVTALVHDVIALRGWLVVAGVWFAVMAYLELVNPARPREMHTLLYGFVSGAGVFALAGLGFMPRREVSPRAVFWVLWCMALGFLMLVNWKIVISHVDHPEWVARMHLSIRLSVLALLAALPAWFFGRQRAAIALLGFVVFAMLLDRTFVLAASTSPRIDVFTLAGEASAALWRGENPYAADYSNLYASTSLDLGYSPGYNYWPAMLMANSLAGKLFGDVRAFFVLSEIAGAFFIYRFARAFDWDQCGAWMLTAMWCCNGFSFQIIEKWNDSLVLAAVLGMLAMLAERRWLLAGVAFGIAAASKQYAPLALPPLAIWFWRSGPTGSMKRFVGGAALGGGLVSLPFLFNQPAWLLHRTVLHFARTPFRDDSLSLLNVIRAALGLGVDSAFVRIAPFFGLAIGLAVACALVWRSRPYEPSDLEQARVQLQRLVAALLLTWAGFFHFIKQSFLNYHYFSLAVSVLLLVSVAQYPQIVRVVAAVRPKSRVAKQRASGTRSRAKVRPRAGKYAGG